LRITLTIAEQSVVLKAKEKAMNSSTTDQVKGAFHEVKGAIKEIAGIINDDPLQESAGANEKVAGKVQGKVGQIKKVFGQ
jgi:uncharacterized protein YjbJ (UPF0337 family)